MSGIDWNRVKERLRNSELALEKAFESDPEKVEHILLSRARTLARKEEEKGQEKAVFLKFRLSEQSYAIALKDLAGVHKFPSFTPLPEAPSYLLGLVSHRGKFLSLLNLKRLLLEEDTSPENVGIAFILKSLRAACCVDALEDIVELDSSDIRPLKTELLDLGPGGLLVLSGSRLAEHSYFKTREVGL